MGFVSQDIPDIIYDKQFAQNQMLGMHHLRGVEENLLEKLNFMRKVIASMSNTLRGRNLL